MWGEIMAQSIDSSEPLADRNAKSLFRDLKFRLQVAAELDLYLASRFNVFRYVGRNEPLLSDIIRDLLDPRGIHGQGPTFLNRFLGLLRLAPTAGPAEVRVEREVVTRQADNSGRKIDIVVRLGNRLAVGIENKPWAGDQPGWVKDYSDHLSRTSDNYVLVFLAREGREPETDEDKRGAHELEEQGRFATLSYKVGFTKWLRQCEELCRAERVRRFLRDFMDYAHTLEVYTMASEQERKVVVGHLYQYPEDLATAYVVEEAVPDVRRRVVFEFLSSLYARS
jgi:PD-(D/E)XK nuclease superfamily